MAIIKKDLGNRPDVIAKAFKEAFSDGLGGMRFDAFCVGWKASWKECQEQLQAENERLRKENERLTAVTNLCCNNQLSKKKLKQALKG